ncbi:MAG TPA: helix-turn-helix transcriptional regulator [Solirubrobacteraceae bacterium]|jgi:DNA-binding CsgD family transcriptional regulator|nr:helix-turn-helix transcriptional regulator [Solirubrobacteraceae bacterium]
MVSGGQDLSADGCPPTPNSEPRLRSREAEVLELVARGARTRDIADALGIAEQTARTHLKNARKRLGVRTTAHAIALAYAEGLIDPDLDHPIS